MKVALIPPISELSRFCTGRSYHLLLTHLFSNRSYIDHYITERPFGSYLVLDNSAHEFGEGQKFNILLERAIEVKAQEIVLPDKLFSGPQTFELTETALSSIIHSSTVRKLWEQTPRRLMIVPQGKTFGEYCHCFYKLLRLYSRTSEKYPKLFPFPVTVGLSKDYDRLFAGGLYYLLEGTILPTIDKISEEADPIQIHLLGWTRNLWNLIKIRESFGDRIRSIDSARPFVYGLYETRLSYSTTPKYPGRPEDYFDLSLTPVQQSISLFNIKMFEAAAGHDR